MREIIFDTETTGLDPKSGDRLVEIGCVEMVNRVTTGAPSTPISIPIATCRPRPSGCTACPPPSWPTSRAFMRRSPISSISSAIRPLVAHNAGFDFGFLNGAGDVRAPAGEPRADGRYCRLARVRHPGAKNSLDALCTRYGIDRSHRTKHGALLDAELLAQVYVELTGGRQIGLSLAAEPTWSRLPPLPSPRRERLSAPARPHGPSEAELAHMPHSSTIKSPLWLD
jgi:DNA polymerase III subunit epsilon